MVILEEIGKNNYELLGANHIQFLDGLPLKGVEKYLEYYVNDKELFSAYKAYMHIRICQTIR